MDPPELKYNRPAAWVAPQATRRNVTLPETLCSAGMPLKVTAARGLPDNVVPIIANEVPMTVNVPPIPYCHCTVLGPVAERLRLYAAMEA